MDVTEFELRAICRVLDEKISRKADAGSHSTSNRQRTLLGVAILQGAGVQSADLSSPRGVYGNLLMELTVHPGLEGIELPESDRGHIIWPTWFDGVSGENLVSHSRKLGLHRPKSANAGVSFVGSPAFTALFDGSEGGKRASLCRIWYEEALQAVLEHGRNVRRDVKVIRNPTAELRENFHAFIEGAGNVLQLPYLASASDIRRFSEDLRRFVEKNCPEGTSYTRSNGRPHLH